MGIGVCLKSHHLAQVANFVLFLVIFFAELPTLYLHDPKAIIGWRAV